MNTGLKANFMLLIVTIFWGSSYLFMKMGLVAVQEFNLIALRFGMAFILSGTVFHRRLIHVDFKTIKYAFWLGTILFSVFASITFGVKFTSASNAGFLVSLTVVFVPLLLAAFFRKMPENRVILGVLLALTGIGFLTLKNQFIINSGDFLCILGALIYAIYIIVTGKLTKDVDSITLGVLQLGFAGAWGLLFSAFLEQPQLPSTTEAWVSVLELSIFCSAIGFVVQTAAQKYTTPTHTGLLFSLEPVFAVLFAFAFADERLTIKGYVGAGLVLLSVLTTQIDLKKVLKKQGFRKSNVESELTH
ncbi:EamA-like transporter family protein [Paenibacillus sophorae]|uniref:DMT family transporter n=1 Tax=Paenibacillus sophorae TaxID=1333845 RepID=A0A1H8RS81_9BACL|nr:DMT family transporter [Paenibacillus sophorae]QWU17001.1 DMT family transporter [Paenibacillus sophorae]SEO69230.1 EamA-like transporter family protein [Paenibacillus sophorae]